MKLEPFSILITSKERIFVEPSSTIALLGGMKLISVKYDDDILTTSPSAVLPSLRIVTTTSSLLELTVLAAFSHIQLTRGAVDELIEIVSITSPFANFRSTFADAGNNPAASGIVVMFSGIDVVVPLASPMDSEVTSKFIPESSATSSEYNSKKFPVFSISIICWHVSFHSTELQFSPSIEIVPERCQSIVEEIITELAR